MEAELVEIRDFLAAQPPFDRLPAEVLDRLPRELSVRYFRRGSAFPPADARSAYLYVIRTGAVEFRDSSASLLGKYGEGELYSEPCIGDLPELSRGTVVEDCLCYLLPCERLEKLRESHPSFSEHFTRSVAIRLRNALNHLQRSSGPDGLMNISLGELVTREPVCIAPGASIQQAAQLMSEKQVSCLLIIENDLLVGIATDRDLRSRCLATRLSPTAPIRSVMSTQLRTARPDTPGYEAMLIMARRGIHHLPVLDKERVTGVITLTDLMRHHSANAAYLTGSIRKAGSLEALCESCAALPQLQARLVASGISGLHIGQTIASVSDAITVRLIELAQMQLGPAPVPYVWMAVGSEARREQTVHSDQDHALILSDTYRHDIHDAYFSRLAQFVSEGLYGCGFEYCPGNVMATNPQWRQPYSGWRSYFKTWITHPEEKSVMLANNFFDMRPIHGDATLWSTVQSEALLRASENGRFMAHLTANALRSRPPLGFFRNFVLIHGGEHANTLDIKRSGIMLVTELARVYAITAGLREVNTCERLRAAAQLGIISQEGAANLGDAFELMTAVRAGHQAEQIKSGRTPDNYVFPSELSALERGHLKDAFSVINTMQRTLEQR